MRRGHLLGDDRFSKPPYLGQHGCWVTVRYNTLSEAELYARVIDSYRRIAGKKLLAQPDATASSATSTNSAKPPKTKKQAAAKLKRARIRPQSGRPARTEVAVFCNVGTRIQPPRQRVCAPSALVSL